MILQTGAGTSRERRYLISKNGELKQTILEIQWGLNPRNGPFAEFRMTCHVAVYIDSR